MNESAKEALDDLIVLMKTYPKARFILEGHTDDLGSDAYNLDLSQHRADSAYGYLLNQGIAADRIEIIAVGESQPLVANDSWFERQKNRTVRFIRDS